MFRYSADSRPFYVYNMRKTLKEVIYFAKLESIMYIEFMPGLRFYLLTLKLEKNFYS